MFSFFISGFIDFANIISKRGDGRNGLVDMSKEYGSESRDLKFGFFCFVKYR